jgi:hypothetical protein
MNPLKNLIAISLIASAVARAEVIPQNIPIGKPDNGTIYYYEDLANSTAVKQWAATLGATADVSFLGSPVQLLTLGTNVTITLTDLAPSRQVKLIVYNPEGGTLTTAFGSGIVWMDNPTTNVLTTKRAVITFTSTGTNLASVVAEPIRQP